MKVYIELRDWWIGYYRGDTHHYVCPLPTLVIRWPRRRQQVPEPQWTTLYPIPGSPEDPARAWRA